MLDNTPEPPWSPMRHARTFAVSVVAVLTLGACGQVGSPSVAPSAPTFHCTPIFGGEAATCDQAQYEHLVAQRAQYAEAERIYTDSVALTWTLIAAKKPANDEILATATGDYRKSLISDLKENQSSDLVITGRQKVEWMKPAQAVSSGSTLAMSACISPGTLKIVAADGKVDDAWYAEEVQFKDVDGQLRISAMSGKVVTSC